MIVLRRYGRTPTEEHGQGAVDLVLAHTVFYCQTAVIYATDEVRPALDSAKNLVIDINQAPNEHRIGIQPGVDRVQHLTVNLDLAGPFPKGFGGEVGGFLLISW